MSFAASTPFTWRPRLCLRPRSVTSSPTTPGWQRRLRLTGGPWPLLPDRATWKRDGVEGEGTWLLRIHRDGERGQTLIKRRLFIDVEGDDEGYSRIRLLIHSWPSARSSGIGVLRSR